MAVAHTVASRPRGVDPSILPWLVVGGLSAALLLWTQPFAAEFLGGLPSWIAKYPSALNKPVVAAINAYMDWFVETFRWFYAFISWGLGWPMTGLQVLLQCL